MAEQFHNDNQKPLNLFLGDSSGSRGDGGGVPRTALLTFPGGRHVAPGRKRCGEAAGLRGVEQTSVPSADDVDSRGGGGEGEGERGLTGGGSGEGRGGGGGRFGVYESDLLS